MIAMKDYINIHKESSNFFNGEVSIEQKIQSLFGRLYFWENVNLRLQITL